MFCGVLPIQKDKQIVHLHSVCSKTTVLLLNPELCQSFVKTDSDAEKIKLRSVSSEAFPLLKLNILS